MFSHSSWRNYMMQWHKMQPVISSQVFIKSQSTMSTKIRFWQRWWWDSTKILQRLPQKTEDKNLVSETFLGVLFEIRTESCPEPKQQRKRVKSTILSLEKVQAMRALLKKYAQMKKMCHQMKKLFFCPWISKQHFYADEKLFKLFYMIFLKILHNVAIYLFCITYYSNPSKWYISIPQDKLNFLTVYVLHNFTKYFSGARVNEIVNNCIIFAICNLWVCKKCLQNLCSIEK